MAEGVKITQLTPWNGGISIEDGDLFEVARGGNSFKISATTLAAAIINKLQTTLDKYALKDNTVGYPAEKTAVIPKWNVKDSVLFESLYSNQSFFKNTQINGTLNNTRSYLYSDDFEREVGGFSIWKSTGGWNVECDNLYVRKAIKAKEYVIESINSLKGTVVLSAANGEIKSVEEVTYNSKEMYQVTFEGDLLSYVPGDIILHQNYGDPANPTTQRMYIAVVQSITDDNKAIRLNKSDFVSESDIPIQDIPTVGDETVQYGNISNVDRQGIIQLSAAYNIDGSGSKPYISVITDINGRYGTEVTEDELIEGNISTSGKTRGIFGHLKEFPYRPSDTAIQPNTGFGIATDNGLFSGRGVLTDANVVNLFTVGGSIDDGWNISGGTCGLYGGNEYSEKVGNSTTAPVRIFCGGNYQAAQKGNASIIMKEDGSGSLAGGNISWDELGNSKIIGELSIVTPSGAKDLISYIKGVQDELQNQIDKAVESWFYPFDPADNRPPVTIWINESISSERPLATVLKQHVNDTFTNVWDGTPGIDPNTGISKGGTIGASWRWTLKSGTTGESVSDYQWTQITDTVLKEVLRQLGEVANVANGKVTTYVTSYPEHNKNGIAADQPPLNYKKGDMWYNTTTTSIKVSTADNVGFDILNWNAVVDHSLDYLKDTFQQAFNNNTKITGGLISTTALRLGGYQTTSGGTDVWIEQAGLSGMNPTKGDAIRAWFGGQLNADDTTASPIYFRANGTGKIGRMEVTSDALKFWGANTSTPLLEINSSSSTLVMNGSGTFTGIVNATGGSFNNITVGEFTIGTGKIGPFYVANAATTNERWGPGLITTMDGSKPPANHFSFPNSFRLYGGNDSAIGWAITGTDAVEYIESKIGISESGSITGMITVKADNSMRAPIRALQNKPSLANSISSEQTFAGIFAGQVYNHGLVSPWQAYTISAIDIAQNYKSVNIFECPPIVFMQVTSNINLAVPYGKAAAVPTYNDGATDDLYKVVTFVNVGTANLIIPNNLTSGWQLRKVVGQSAGNQTVGPGWSITIAFRMRYGDAYIINHGNYGM